MNALLMLAASTLPIWAADGPPVLRLEPVFDAGPYSSDASFSRDGKTLSVLANGIAFYDAETGIQRGFFPREDGCSKGRVWCGGRLVGLSPDGKLAAIDSYRHICSRCR